MGIAHSIVLAACLSSSIARAFIVASMVLSSGAGTILKVMDGNAVLHEQAVWLLHPVCRYYTSASVKQRCLTAFSSFLAICHCMSRFLTQPYPDCILADVGPVRAAIRAAAGTTGVVFECNTAAVIQPTTSFKTACYIPLTHRIPGTKPTTDH